MDVTDLLLTPESASALEPSSGPLVIGAAQSEQPDGPVTIVPSGVLPAADEAALVAGLRSLHATGKAEELSTVVLPGSPDLPSDGSRGRVVVVVGLGRPRAGTPAFDPDLVRRVAGTASRSLAGHTSAVSFLGLVNGRTDALAPTAAAAVEGTLLGGYAYRRLRTPKPDIKDPVATVSLVVPDPAADRARDAAEAAVVVAHAVERTRDWVNAPPNLLTPADVVALAQGLAAEHGLEVTVWDDEALRAEGFGGITAVGQGSENPPRLVRIRWSPGTPQAAATRLGLVGKGITFDSGGISLKPPTSMVTMKSDMAGAAAVLSATVAAAQLGLPAEVTGWLALAENMPSGRAQRPGDVITMYGGRTVEVLNTDAEGRLVLGDAIARAFEDTPDHLVVVATLTGAQGVALGVRTCGVMGEAGLRDRVVSAADSAGEPMWPMPLPEDVRRAMDSEVADIANIGDGAGGMLAGGLFLREFVPEGASWAHVDIARPAFNSGSPFGFTPKGATGVPVRTLVTLIGMLAADSGDE